MIVYHEFEWKNNGTNDEDYKKMYELGYICLLGDDEMYICKRFEEDKILLTVRKGNIIFANKDIVEIRHFKN